MAWRLDGRHSITCGFGTVTSMHVLSCLTDMHGNITKQIRGPDQNAEACGAKSTPFRDAARVLSFAGLPSETNWSHGKWKAAKRSVNGCKEPAPPFVEVAAYAKGPEDGSIGIHLSLRTLNSGLPPPTGQQNRLGSVLVRFVPLSGKSGPAPIRLFRPRRDETRMGGSRLITRNSAAFWYCDTGIGW